MAGAPGFQKIERLGPTHLADRNAVGPKSERRADKIGERRYTIPGPHRDEVGCGALEFARVLAQDDAVAAPGDLGQQVGDRKSVVEGKGVAVRVEFGGRRLINTTKPHETNISELIASINKP